MIDRSYLTVTGLTRHIKRMFERQARLRDVRVKGELSNFKRHSRGHMYFTLKDENSRIQSVMFAGHNEQLAFSPEDGMKVICRGEVTVYEPFGQYQLYVKEMEPDGVGALFLAFEQLKRKLESEGLFAAKAKKKLPAFPERIAIITSPTGAAVRDIFTTIKRRFPVASLTIIPALVQGKQAASSLVKALDAANRDGSFDVIIIGRGGGSIEELWAFNEESVARKIYASQIPVISAVGHETDYTIADFVADLRAPTPTGAGEMAVPDFVELLGRIGERKRRLIRALREKMTAEKKRLKRLQSAYAFRYPQRLVEQKEQQLDRFMEMMEKEVQRLVHRNEERLSHLEKLVSRNDPQKRLKQAEKERAEAVQSLKAAFVGSLQKKETHFRHEISRLNALNPLRVLERGFSVTEKTDGTIVRSAHEVQHDEKLLIRLKDGRIHCHVRGIEKND